ncbi:MAG: hypothetical protein FJ368_03430 [Pelagibacterales bacterium]|nr:hypothetical protein [Pelagibacterales bacterium]
MTKISKILLTNFRNFSQKKLNFSKKLVCLFGENGVGKTNILESITLLGRFSSLRGSDFEEMLFSKDENLANQFSIYSEILDHDFIEKVGISFDKVKKKKNIQINEEILTSKRQSELKNQFINVIYLTPQIESLFILGKSERRDYLDKIVADIDFNHNSRINDYKKLLKERLLILQKYKFNNQKQSANKWLDIIEDKIVETGIAIASARIEAVDFFNKAINSFSSNFPKTQLQVTGDIEQMVMRQSSVLLEEFYKQKLRENREVDLENFKTNFGVHRSDFDAVFVLKKVLATKSSTGEQKSIMISITLARAKISAIYKNQPTILIFDEVVSHLDEKRKNDLFEEIKMTNLQTFFSVTSKSLIPQHYLENDVMEFVEVI